MTGILIKTEEGWMVNSFYETPSSIPLHPDNALYCLDSDHGKEIDFQIVISALDWSKSYAQLIGSEARKQTLAYLANQAQELNMGYEPEWDEFFEESEKVLNFELPLRYKNWLKNRYKTPTKI
jgi:hypothetical protein